MYAFRCKNCGYLESAAHAGESPIPHACRVCKMGVVFAATAEDVLKHEHCRPHAEALKKCHAAGDLHKHHLQGGRHVPLPAGIPASKYLIHENWEVLADADDARLTELNLSRNDVVRHTPKKFVANGTRLESQLIKVDATDGIATTDVAG